MAKQNPKIGPYTFDEWVKLAKEGEERFEEERKKFLVSVIGGFLEEKRLRLSRFQFRIDGIRWRFRKNSLVCTECLYKEMWSSHMDCVSRLRMLYGDRK